MLALGQATNNQRGLAKMLGANRRNIQKAMDRQIQLDTTKDAFWITSSKTIKFPTSICEKSSGALMDNRNQCFPYCKRCHKTTH